MDSAHPTKIAKKAQKLYHFTLITIHMNFVQPRYIAALHSLYWYQILCEIVLALRQRMEKSTILQTRK